MNSDSLHAWFTKDTVVMIAVMCSIAFTAIALWLQTKADQLSQISSLPRIARSSEDDTTRQERFAKEAAGHRAAAEHAQLNRTIGNGFFILAVVASGVAATPWLLYLATAFAACMGLYYYWMNKRVTYTTKLHLKLYTALTLMHKYSLSTPYMTDQVIQSELEAVFNTPDRELENLRQSYVTALLVKRKEHKDFIKAQQQPRKL